MMRRCAPRLLRCLQNRQLTACLDLSGAGTESVARLCTPVEAVRTANILAQPWCMWLLQGKQGHVHFTSLAVLLLTQCPLSCSALA